MENLFTIGHSTHPFPVFVGLLKRHGVTAVADVRSIPYSRRHPQYNREVLASALRTEGIEYVFLGKEFGARRTEPEIQAAAASERLALVARLPIFQAGRERLRRGLERFDVALMCAEQDPLFCHRHLWISRHLISEWPEIAHIREDGRLESHTELESRLLERCQLPAADTVSRSSGPSARSVLPPWGFLRTRSGGQRAPLTTAPSLKRRNPRPLNTFSQRRISGTAGRPCGSVYNGE